MLLASWILCEVATKQELTFLEGATQILGVCTNVEFYMVIHQSHFWATLIVAEHVVSDTVCFFRLYTKHKALRFYMARKHPRMC